MAAAPALLVRPIRKEDDAGIAGVIRKVMPEFGASGPGFAILDPEVDSMTAAYAGPRSAYFVAHLDGSLIGGGGIAPLEGGDAGTCELRKMYLLAEGRGHGAGRRLMEECLKAARERGFRRCYLETLTNMTEARKLYQKNGFKPIEGPLGATGHFGCNCFYLLEL